MDSEGKRQEHYRLASQIATLCATLGENPHVRYDDKPVATAVATVLQEKLDAMARPGTRCSRHVVTAQRPRDRRVPAARPQARPSPAASSPTPSDRL